VRAFLIVLAAAVVLSCADTAVHQPFVRDWGLRSWKPRGQPWHYAFIYPDDANTALDDYKITHSSDVVVGEQALKLRLATFPPRTSIVWRDDPPKYVLKFPSPEYRQKIKDWAQSKSIHILVMPTIYE
jgi:hypothetical protein